jgi:hypothetical protein
MSRTGHLLIRAARSHPLEPEEAVLDLMNMGNGETATLAGRRRTVPPRKDDHTDSVGRTRIGDGAVAQYGEGAEPIATRSPLVNDAPHYVRQRG